MNFTNLFGIFGIFFGSLAQFENLQVVIFVIIELILLISLK